MPADDWLVVGCGNDLAPSQDEYLREVSRSGRPGPALTDHWLEADLDLARLGPWLPDAAQLLKPARVKISVAPNNDNLDITARLVYAEAVPWKSAPLQAPDLVEGPAISFSSGQDVAAFLKLSPAFARLDGDPLTNQFYTWALNQLPFQTYMAWPALNATNLLETLSTEAVDAFNAELKQFNGTELVWLADQRKLVLSNLRVIFPCLQAVEDPAGSFLLVSVFPRAPAGEPAPDELLKPVNGRTNLVYYDWEMTGARFQHWRLLGHMLLTRMRANAGHQKSQGV